MGIGGHSVGVISGVPLSVDPDMFMDVVGVRKARRMKRFREGKMEPSQSICITFYGDLPERVYLDYVTYRVRPYEKGPLRCFCCQEYGHAAAVCRGVRKCGRCGETNCEETCEAQEKEPVCVHCKGSHHAGAASCPRRITELNVKRVRESKGITYAEAVKRIEEKRKPTKEHKVEEKRNEDVISMDKRKFLAFIAMVINCAVEMQGKSERIKMVLEAARRFLNIEDISGEDIDCTLREGSALAQANGSG